MAGTAWHTVSEGQRGLWKRPPPPTPLHPSPVTSAGIKRSVNSVNLWKAEWEGELVLAPLEVRYHHRFVTQLIGYFLGPWDEWAAVMEFEEGLVEQLAQLMDSRFNVTLTSLDVLVVHAFLAPHYW